MSSVCVQVVIGGTVCSPVYVTIVCTCTSVSWVQISMSCVDETQVITYNTHAHTHTHISQTHKHTQPSDTQSHTLTKSHAKTVSCKGRADGSMLVTVQRMTPHLNLWFAWHAGSSGGGIPGHSRTKSEGCCRGDCTGRCVEGRLCGKRWGGGGGKERHA